MYLYHCNVKIFFVSDEYMYMYSTDVDLQYVEDLIHKKYIDFGFNQLYKLIVICAMIETISDNIVLFSFFYICDCYFL